MSSSTEFRAAPPPALPVRSVLVDDVYEAIKTWIMDSVREPGIKANIDALSRSLEVSHTPVREALARLAAEGFVVKEPSRGYTVTAPLTAEQVADLYEFRLLLEPWAAGRAALRGDDRAERLLLAELATCPEAPDADNYEAYRAIAAHDERFHDLVLDLAGNEPARRAFAGTNCHLHIFRLSYGRGMGMRALHEHQVVADAIIAGDDVAASAAMNMHLTRSRDRIAEVFVSDR
ncbi:GntR family transcriptional regulator [Actinospongicola halichondriae]|uniref:GntR family transcriptional regulator n=1 Tax=Actinospongicola halichondriae TaxID=3236844 RepID=UPI003D5BF16B